MCSDLIMLLLCAAVSIAHHVPVKEIGREGQEVGKALGHAAAGLLGKIF